MRRLGVLLLMRDSNSACSLTVTLVTGRWVAGWMDAWMAGWMRFRFEVKTITQMGFS